MKNLARAVFFCFLSFSLNAQQADSDQRDSLGRARIIVPVNLLKDKPASAFKKDVQQEKARPAPAQAPNNANKQLEPDTKR